MEIIFDKTLGKKTIHPATSYIDNKLYFGVVLPAKMSEQISPVFCFVNSNREYFPATEEELNNRNLKLQLPSVWLDRWSIDGVKNFVNGYTVTTEDMFKSLCKTITEYLDFPDEREVKMIALWIMGTYLISIWETYPYITISGVKRVGKSKTLTFLSLTAFNALLSVDISVPVLYRLIQSLKATILFDEAEALSSSDRKTDLRNILYNGYKRGAYVFRAGKTAGERIIPESFMTFSAKAIVTFTGVEDVLAERSLPIVMLRTTKKVGDVEIRESDPIWQKLRDDLYAWALSNFNIVKDYYDSIEVPEISQRHRELWNPILALAKVAGVYEEILELAKEKIRQSVEDDINETRQMILLRVLLKNATTERDYSIQEIREWVLNYLEPGEDNKWVTNQWISRTLSKSFRLMEGRRKAKRALRYIKPEVLKELAKKYNIPLEEEEEEYTEGSVKRYIEKSIESGETDWVRIYENVRANMKFDDPIKIFGWIAEKMPQSPFVLIFDCDFEQERVGNRRKCLIGIECCVENPDRCPIKKKLQAKEMPTVLV